MANVPEILHYYCAIHFGFIMPAWYFLTVRRQNLLAETWWLGRGTNTSWTILVGAICMGWLAWRLLGAGLSGRRVKFGGRIDRIVGMIALALCLWFHLKTILATDVRPGWMRRRGIGTVSGWFMEFAYPQSHFLGATLVYGLAAAEAWGRREPRVRPLARRWSARIAAALILIIFLPFLLTIPKYGHERTMMLLYTHRNELVKAAEAARLDPRLLAGIAYAQHRMYVSHFMERVLQSRPYYGESQLELVPSRPRGLMQDIIRSGPTKLTSLRDQWRDAGCPISKRPEILATLYDIGHENSHPKRDPRANRFGRRVKKFMESDACREWLEGVEQ